MCASVIGKVLADSAAIPSLPADLSPFKLAAEYHKADTWI